MQGKMTITGRIIAVFVGVLLTLAVFYSIEWVLRLSDLRSYSSAQFYVWPPNKQKIFHPSPDVMPGIKGKSRFETNRWGIRGRQFTAESRYRILTIGGSTTECLYLDQLESWPSLLEQALNTKIGVNAIWVGNVGKSGTNTNHHIVQIDKILENYPKVDMIILLIGINDFLRRLGLDEEYFLIDRQSEDYQEKLMNKAFSVRPGWDDEFPLYKRTEIWRLLRDLKYRLFSPKIDPEVQDDAGLFYVEKRERRGRAVNIREQLPELASALQDYAKNIREIVQLAKEKNVAVVFLTQPSIWRADLSNELINLLWLGRVGQNQENIGDDYYSIGALSDGMELYNDRLLKLCGELDLNCLDLARHVPKDTSAFYDDAHFNEQGAERVAELVEEYLIEEGLLPGVSTYGSDLGN